MLIRREYQSREVGAWLETGFLVILLGTAGLMFLPLAGLLMLWLGCLIGFAASLLRMARIRKSVRRLERRLARQDS